MLVSDLDATAKLVAVALGEFVNSRTLSAYPSVGTLAELCSMSRRATGQAIERIEGAGFVTVKRSKGRASHLYKITTPGGLNRAPDAQFNRASDDTNRASDDTNRARGAQELEELEGPVSYARSRARQGKREGGALARLSPQEQERLRAYDF